MSDLPLNGRNAYDLAALAWTPDDKEFG